MKRSEAGMVDEPITISPDATIGEADAMCGRYRISGVPVVDRDLTLLGIVTNRDMRFETDPNRLVGDVMTKMPLVTGLGGHRPRGRDGAAGPAQDREAAAGRRPGPAQGSDHPQGLRQVRPVPERHQGRPGPAPGGRGGRLLRRLLEAGDGPGRGGRRPAGRRHRARSLPRRGRHGRVGSRPRPPAATSTSWAATSRPTPGPRPWSMPESTGSRSVSGRARSAPPGWSPASASRR